MDARAGSTGTTATAVVVESLRAHLDAPLQQATVEPLPVYGSPDGRVLVDLADRDAVRAAPDDRP